MTNRALDLDAALEDWLRGAPRLSADQVVASALNDVSATRQDRGRLFAVDVTVFRLGLFAATVAALAVGFALEVGPWLVTTPSPSPDGQSVRPVPSAEAEPSPDTDGVPPGMRLYRNEEDGYELRIPSAWDLRSDAGHVRVFGSARGHPYGALTISVGTRDGTIDLCRSISANWTANWPRFGLGDGGGCAQLRATTLDELNQVLVARIPNAPLPEIHYDTVLDGLPAGIDRVQQSGIVWAGPTFYYLYTIREDGSPVVLAFDYWHVRQALIPGGGVNGIRSSFRFLDEPDAPWQTLRFPGAGLQVSAPASWWVREETDSYVRLGGPGGEMEIRQGTGRIGGLSPPGIERTIAVDSIDDLVSIARGEYRTRWGITMQPTMVQAPITLDGIPAVRLTISPPRGMTGPGTSHFVLAYHDGQALLIEWIPDFSSAELFDDIVDAIRFVD